jgi:hypothetical protein
MSPLSLRSRPGAGSFHFAAPDFPHRRPPYEVTCRRIASRLRRSMGLVRWPAKPASRLRRMSSSLPNPLNAIARDGTPRAAPAHQLQAAAVGPTEVADEPVEVLRARDLQGRGEAAGRQGRVAALAQEAGPYRRGRPVAPDRGDKAAGSGPENPRCANT